MIKSFFNIRSDHICIVGNLLNLGNPFLSFLESITILTISKSKFSSAKQYESNNLCHFISSDDGLFMSKYRFIELAVDVPLNTLEFGDRSGLNMQILTN